MSDAKRDLLREVVTGFLPKNAYIEKTQNIDNLVNLENEVYKTPYSDETTTTFYEKYNDLLSRFNSYVITDNKQFLERLNKLKNRMDEVVKYKEHFLSQYEKVKITASTTPNTFLEEDSDKEYNNDIYYDIVMDNNITANELGKIINVSYRKQYDQYIRNSYNSNSDARVNTLYITFTRTDDSRTNVPYLNFPVSLYKKKIIGGRRKLKSMRRKMSGKRRRRKTLNKKRRGKK